MTSVRNLCLVLFACLSFQASLVLGHGRLIEPASRNAAWRYGFGVPPNFDDNGLNCGGTFWQWSKVSGKCGVCGDGYNLPQLHVYPGKYAKGVITKHYTTGQIIRVKIDITANHMGYFEFRLGKLQTPPVTQSKLTHLLKLPNGDTRWFLNGNEENLLVTIELKLPDDLSCDHCVLQWFWRSGNSWGCGNNGCGIGYGPQESYANCADIKIEPNSGGETNAVAETEVTAQTTYAPTPMETAADVKETNPPEIDSNNIAHVSNIIPTTVTEGTTAETIFGATQTPENLARPVMVENCQAVGLWEGDKGKDQWCLDNCSRGYCPEQYCVCVYQSK